MCETLSYKLEFQPLYPKRICAHGMTIMSRGRARPNLKFGKEACVLSKGSEGVSHKLEELVHKSLFSSGFPYLKNNGMRYETFLLS